MISALKNQSCQILFYTFCAFFLSLWLLQFNDFLTPDGVNYARIGINFFSGKGITSNPGEVYTPHPPLYGILVGFFHLFIPNLESAAHLVSMVAFASTVLPLFLISKKIYGAKSAHWASLLYMTNGFLLVYSNITVVEPLFTLLLMTELLLFQDLVLSNARQIKKAAGAGFIAGLSLLTQPGGLLFFIAGLFSVFIFSGKSRKDKAITITFFAASFLLLLLPYLMFIHHHLGQWQISRSAPFQVIFQQAAVSNPDQYIQTKKTLFGLTPDKTRRQIDALIDHFRLIDYVKKDNFVLIKAGFSSAIWRLQEISQYFFLGLGWMFFGLSFLDQAWKDDRKKSEGLLILFFLSSFSHIFLMPDPRRYLPIFPILLIWMGHGIEAIRRWAERSFGWNQKKSLILAAGICLGTALLSGLDIHHALHRIVLPLEHREMGIWMKKNIPAIVHEKVLTEHPYVHFYSGASYVFFPCVKNFDDFKTYAGHHHVKYLVISSDFDPIYRESYGFLLDENKPLPRGIKRLHTVHQKSKMVLFEIENQT